MWLINILESVILGIDFKQVQTKKLFFSGNGLRGNNNLTVKFSLQAVNL